MGQIKQSEMSGEAFSSRLENAFDVWYKHMHPSWSVESPRAIWFWQAEKHTIFPWATLLEGERIQLNDPN